MKVLLTGSHGLVGSALAAYLVGGGHQVVRAVRRNPEAGDVLWDPVGQGLDPESLAGVDALVHLAGESIASGRWTPEVKRRIRDSRTQGTRLLSEALAALPDPPKVVVSASAIGIYGSRGEQWLNETAPVGDDFLAEVCQGWEAAWGAAEAKGIRVVKLRFGLILSPQGGALARMLLPFQLGLGGRLGSGRQWMSWIALDDVLGIIQHALVTPDLVGAVNAVAPEPVSNLQFTRILARVLQRPAVAWVPSLAARLAFGEMADALLLTSARVVPEKLQQSGYRFAYPHLEEALRHVLGR